MIWGLLLFHVTDCNKQSKKFKSISSFHTVKSTIQFLSMEITPRRGKEQYYLSLGAVLMRGKTPFLILLGHNSADGALPSQNLSIDAKFSRLKAFFSILVMQVV